MIAGLTLLYFGAEWLVKGSVGLSLRLGISPLVVGLTVVAFGTSAPELVVSLQFNVFAGMADAAVGNVVGSNICNIALILGVAAALAPIGVKARLVRREMPILIVISGLFVYFLQNGNVGRLEGALLTLGIVVYTVFSFREARREKDPEVLAEVEDLASEAPVSGRSAATVLATQLGFVLLGVATLVAGAKLLEVGAVGLARTFGVSEAIIGLTLLAFGTSLPELATSVVASMKGQGDIIVGNVIGSCIFNILMIIGVSAMLRPMEVREIRLVDLGFMVGLALILVPMMLSRWRIARLEGVVLLAIYGVYCYLLARREGLVG